MYQENHNKLFQSYLNTYAKPLESLEFIISSQCDQKCEYCYLQKHDKEMNYPRANKKDNILRNFKLLLDYFDKEGYEYTVYDIFSGEFFRLPFWEDVLQILYDYQKDCEKERCIDVPTNFSFCGDEKLYNRVKYWVDKMFSINCPMHLSCSIDGPEQTDAISRPNATVVKDEKFYERLFSLMAEKNFAFHPMISKYFLQNYKENYDWFISNIKKYNLSFIDTHGRVTLNVPMMLEVRDSDEWDEETLKLYKEFLWYVAETDLREIFDGDKEKFALKVFDDFSEMYDECTDVMRNQPYIINYPMLSGNRMSCSIQKNLAVRVGDLTVAPCHRLFYEEFEYGSFITNEEKTEIIGVEGRNTGMAFKIANLNPCRSNLKCGGCKMKAFCIQGCLGSQYENTTEIFACQEAVCELFNVKYHTIHEICEKMGLYDIILNHPLVPTSRKEFINYAKEILSE